MKTLKRQFLNICFVAIWVGAQTQMHLFAGPAAPVAPARQGDAPSELTHAMVARASEVCRDEWQLGSAGAIGGRVGMGKMGGGLTWTDLGAASIPVAPQAFVGVAVTGTGNKPITATFGPVIIEALTHSGPVNRPVRPAPDKGNGSPTDP